MIAEYITLDILATQLREIKHKLFSGRVLLTTPQGQKWCLYFYLGRILYAMGGNQPIRRWVRNLTIAGVDIGSADNLQTRIESLTNISALTRTELESCWEYYLLANWAKQNRIARQEMVKFLQTTVVEVLFDIVQAQSVSCEQITQAQLAPQLTLIDIEQAFGMAVQQQQQWQQAQLTEISPDMAIEIVAVTEFQQMVSPSAYPALQFVLDGKHTLREIATKTRKSPVKIGQSFLSHIQAGRLRLVEPPDFNNPIDRAYPFGLDGSAPTIACVDDSPFVCDRLEQIFRGAGYQFIGILDSMKALPILIAKKPQLIFLDLVMPNANGYEICSRLRKVAAFRDTPIVILTGNDGVIDRVRAKVVGASDFVTKPVQSELVLEIVQKYLNPAPISSTQTSISSR
jgi:two-component system, chemotaxis family, response regulator PixG